ncbi:hypothetical protein ACFLZ6_00465 [Nanoarchaeota archaeon]
MEFSILVSSFLVYFLSFVTRISAYYSFFSFPLIIISLTLLTNNLDVRKGIRIGLFVIVLGLFMSVFTFKHTTTINSTYTSEVLDAIDTTKSNQLSFFSGREYMQFIHHIYFGHLNNKYGVDEEREFYKNFLFNFTHNHKNTTILIKEANCEDATKKGYFFFSDRFKRNPYLVKGCPPTLPENCAKINKVRFIYYCDAAVN